MKRTGMLFTLALACCCFLTGGRVKDEGMWLLDSVNKLPLGDMKKFGLELSPEQIYNPNGPSLKDAILLLGGGTASFISPEGLILTNHHVAFGGIQALSSVEADYLKNGFWAKTRSEELSTTYTAQLVREIRDVTGEVLSAVNDTMSAERRAMAIRTKIRQVEKSAKGSTDLSCRISETFNGLKYYLYSYESLSDIRLVYAPPSSIGNFGGEVDNWMWPRHTGDFSLMRAYVGPDGKAAKYSTANVPYKPKVFLPFSTKGFSEGSFAMIMGFPGRTFRYREAAAVELAHDESLPATIDLYKTRIDIIDAAGDADRAIEIKYASKVRGIANTYKNYLGVLEGMRRADLLTLKRNDEKQFAAYIAASPALSAKYGTLLADLEKANAEIKTINRKSILLQNLTTGIDLYRLATRFRSYAAQFTVDSTGTPVAPPDSERAALLESIGSLFKNFDLGVEKQILRALILKGADYPVSQQVEALQHITGSRAGAERDEAVQTFVDDLYAESGLATAEGSRKLMEDGQARINEDPLVKFAASLEDEQTPLTATTVKIMTRLNTLRQKYIEAWIGWKNGILVYPDANRSIRLTYGQVKAYSPRDAVTYGFLTTLGGVIEKKQCDDPFIVPDRLVQLWQKKDFGRYADRKAGDVPVAFIANLDITGGNSGSPVINGRGEIIGCAFDGDWEAVVGDYYFQEPLNRTIAVDARYVLFVLDKYSGAENILKELVIR